MSTEGGQVPPYFWGMNTNATLSSADLMALEDAHGAHNYHPLPVVLDRGEGVHVWDVEGKQYFDFLSAYSAVNQGHCHPRIVKAMQDQTAKLTLTSRAFYNSILGPYEKFVTNTSATTVLPMNTGAEAVETAIKIARKWAYDVKGVPSGAAKIVTCSENFHGRTTTIVSFSTDPDSTGGFGPYTPGFEVIPYNDLDALAAALKDPNVAGFLVEPIQGEAGVNCPCRRLRVKPTPCAKRQTCCSWPTKSKPASPAPAPCSTCGNCTCEAKCERQSTYVKADLLILGKAISGGAYPVSAVLADDAVMGVIHPGQHGSTFGEPVAGVVATEALAVVADEKLAQNARTLGARFREAMQELVDESPLLKSVWTRPAQCGPHQRHARQQHGLGFVRGPEGQRPARQAHPRQHHPLRPSSGHDGGAVGRLHCHHREHGEGVHQGLIRFPAPQGAPGCASERDAPCMFAP